MPADDLGFQPSQSVNDLGFQPAAAPKMPDFSGVQKMADSNLAAAESKNSEGEEEKPPLNPQQRLDTATGLPVQNIINGTAKPSDINEENRSHYIDAVKNGTSVNSGDWFQSYFHNIGNAITAGGARAVGTLAYPFLSGEDRQKLIESGTLGEVPTLTGSAGHNLAAEGLTRANAILSPGLGAAFTTVAAPLAPVVGPLITGAQKEAEKAGASPENASLIPPAAELGMNLLGLGGVKAGLHYSDPIIDTVAKKMGTEPADVLPEHVDQAIAAGAKGLMPAAQDFHDVATVMNMDSPDLLHQIYKEVGVHPDQVYSDAQSNPSIAADVAARKVPSAYDVLRDNRKPIHDDYQKLLADTEKHFEENGVAPDLSKEGASTSANPFAKIFNPTGMSEASRDMATALRQGRGSENQDIAVIQDSLQEHAKTFAKMSDEDRLKFIDYIENRSKGAKLDNPELRGVADKIKDIYAQVGQKIQERFPDVGLRKDYFTHQYEDEAAAKKFFSDWVAKQGSERNLQARAFPTLAEAMEAGLKPKTTNPIETVMGYVTNMGNLMAAHRGVELAREAGIAEYFNKGQEPEGWVPLNGNLAEKGGKTLYAPEDAAQVYNNDLSKGATGPAGHILDNIQRMNNFANKLVLGLSGYHFTATTMASMASDVGRALTSGDARERLQDIGKSLTPGSSTLRGQKYIDAYLGRDELSPELQKALDLAVKNNTINVKQQDYWKAGPARDYIDVWRNGSAASELQKAGEAIKERPIVGPVKVVANEVGRLMDTTMKPLFDYYIPRIKIAANIEELHDWLRDHPDSTPEMQDRAAQDIGNSIDNRFGEMMRENLFWHALTKQTLQTALLSYSWVTGAARMLKGIPDTAQYIMNGKELSSSARYLMGMAATYAMVNGVRTYIGTGHAPDDWKDFLYPRTGGTTTQGKEEREILPSHIGQYTNYLHDGIGELGNEASPGLKLIYHLLGNKDWRGLPITNENNSWFKEQRWNDYAHYVLGEETPIGIKNFLQGNKKGSKIGVLGKLLGARQAPRFITDPEGEEAVMKHINDREYSKKLRSDRKLQSQYEESD